MSDTLHTFDTIGVIVGRDLVGDALMKLPFLRALRNGFPRAEISWITSLGPTAYATQLRAATRGLINEVYEQPLWLPTTAQQAPAAFTPAFDLLIDTRNRWRETFYARKIPHKLFLAQAMRYLFSEKRPRYFPFQEQPSHLIDRILELVELAAGFKPPSTGALPVAEDLRQKARLILPEGKTYIGLAPGAGNAAKIWPSYKFEKVALTQAAKGRVPVFVLGPQELDWLDELRSAVPVAKFPLQDYDAWGTAVLSIDQTLALGELLDVAVANDSGVGHMLAAADCKLISLFGPTSPEKLAPRVSQGKIIRAQDFGSDHMAAIQWEAVDEAIDNFVS